jgi:hypothetical protein
MPMAANGEEYEQARPTFIKHNPNIKDTDKTSFWKRSDKGIIKINPERLYTTLREMGFRINADTNELIRVENNIVSHCDKNDILVVLNELLDAESDVKSALILQQDTLITGSRLIWLGRENIPKYHDPKDKCRLFYQNAFVEISRDAIEIKDYAEADFLIPKERILDRDIGKKAECEMDFAKFIENVCTNPDDGEINNETHTSLATAIGYLLHYPRTGDLRKMIMLMDRTLDRNSGRTGKGLLEKAISKMKGSVVTTMSGKNNDFKSKFIFQTLNSWSELLAIHDLPKRFEPETLFNIASDGFDIERKGEKPIHVEAVDAPKVILTTNHNPLGIDDSTQARYYPIELYRFYNNEHQPIDDFDKLFFEDWSKKEWNDFDWMMMDFVQKYLNNDCKLPKPSDGFAKENALIKSIGESFYEVFEELERDRDYTNDELLQICRDSNPRLASVSKRRISLKLSTYAEAKGLILEEPRSEIRYKRLTKA